jgi:hypothetical protein
MIKPNAIEPMVRKTGRQAVNLAFSLEKFVGVFSGIVPHSYQSNPTIFPSSHWQLVS